MTCVLLQLCIESKNYIMGNLWHFYNLPSKIHFWCFPAMIRESRCLKKYPCLLFIASWCQVQYILVQYLYISNDHYHMVWTHVQLLKLCTFHSIFQKSDLLRRFCAHFSGLARNGIVHGRHNDKVHVQCIHLSRCMGQTTVQITRS